MRDLGYNSESNNKTPTTENLAKRGHDQMGRQMSEDLFTSNVHLYIQETLDGLGKENRIHSLGHKFQLHPGTVGYLRAGA